MKKVILLSIILFIVSFNSLNAQILYEDFFTTTGEIPTGWLTVTPTYPSAVFKWHSAEISGNNFIEASSNDGTNHASEQWIISPVFSTSGFDNIELSFNNSKSDDPGNDLQVFLSTDFNGDSTNFNSAVWTEVLNLSLSAGGNMFVNNISDISSVTGNSSVYVAFKYSSSDTEGAIWGVDNVVITGTSDIDRLETRFKIFPNPAVNNLNISSQNTIKNITVSNIIGQIMLTFNDINSNYFKVNISDLKSGVYFIQIENSNKTSEILRFIKK